MKKPTLDILHPLIKTRDLEAGIRDATTERLLQALGEKGCVPYREKKIREELAQRNISAPPVGSSDSKPGITVATGTISHSDDAVVGKQLTAQYKRAVSGMREVLIFGAMLKQVEINLSTRGQVSVGGRGKQGGIAEWLREHAPEISRPTALRFLGVTESVAQEYQAIVGSQIAGRYDLPTLALADPATLPEKARLKQGDLFDYVAGTSQRSWLDQFKGDPYANNGGKRERPNGTNRRTKDVKEYDDKEHVCLDWYKSGFGILRTMRLAPEIAYQHLPDEELANVADILKLITKHADDTCRARRIVPSQLATWHREDAQ
jgi:hypothetical protein